MQVIFGLVFDFREYYPELQRLKEAKVKSGGKKPGASVGQFQTPIGTV